jgi:Protein of unknown function (DUF3313)
MKGKQMNTLIKQPSGIRLFAPLAGVVIGGLLLGLTGCATTHQVSQGVEPSGFLGDYSQLQKGVKDRAVYSYWNPSADWSKYTKIMIEPVQLWKSDDPDSPLGKLSPEKQEMLVSALETALYDRLSKDYTMVNEPGPDVMVIRAAITEAKKSKPVINLVSSVYPAALVLSYGKQVIWGTGTGVGSVTVEGEILDGQTHERLAAAVDRRAGTKAWRSKFNGTFGDVKASFDWWANRLDQRLMEEKNGTTPSTSM